MYLGHGLPVQREDTHDTNGCHLTQPKTANLLRSLPLNRELLTVHYAGQGTTNVVVLHTLTDLGYAASSKLELPELATLISA